MTGQKAQVTAEFQVSTSTDSAFSSSEAVQRSGCAPTTEASKFTQNAAKISAQVQASPATSPRENAALPVVPIRTAGMSSADDALAKQAVQEPTISADSTERRPAAGHTSTRPSVLEAGKPHKSEAISTAHFQAFVSSSDSAGLVSASPVHKAGTAHAHAAKSSMQIQALPFRPADKAFTSSAKLGASIPVGASAAVNEHLNKLVQASSTSTDFTADQSRPEVQGTASPLTKKAGVLPNDELPKNSANFTSRAVLFLAFASKKRPLQPSHVRNER